MNNLEQVNLQKLFRVLIRSILPIALCSVICALSAFLYFSSLVDKQYSATVSLIVDNRSTEDTTEDSTSQKKTNTDISASRMMVESYIAILNNSSVLTSVAQRVNEQNPSIADGSISPLTYQQLKGSLSMSGVNNTEILQIKVTSTDPQLSVDVCYAIVAEAKVVLERTMNTLTVNSIEGDNILPAKQVDTGAVSKTMIAGLLGFAVSYGVALLLSVLDMTVKATDDISEICGYPVIGEVPSIISESGKKKSRSKKLWR